MAAITFENVSKRFYLHHEKRRTFQDMFLRRLTRRNGNGFSSEEEFWALREVSFEVPEGQMVGIIGPNGAGKSTALKLIARIYEPTSGKVSVNGRLNALIELSAGFHPELTGRENIFLSAALLGMSRRDVQARFEEIVDFSELERFIDTQVKHYSSGMHVRLGFAIATCIECDVLLVDEVLAVGDANFHRKCFERIAQIRERGTTIFYVAHQLAEIERQCDRVLLIMNGELAADGPPSSSIRKYEELRRRKSVSKVDFYSAEYLDYSVPKVMYANERFEMTVTFRNTSEMVWNGEDGSGTRLVSLSYHWLDHLGSIYQFSGPRTILPHDLAPGESITLSSLVLPPRVPGTFRLELDLAAEGAGWFGHRGCAGPQIEVQVFPADTPRDSDRETLIAPEQVLSR